jgi:PAS domain S-box-containing protein
VLESISDAFYAVDGQWRVTYINRNAEQLWGKRREEFLGRNLWEAFPWSVGSVLHAAMLRAMRERQAAELEYWSPVLSAWLEVNLYPSGEGLAVYFRDISARKQAEQERYWLQRTAESRVAELAAALESIPDAVFLGNQGIITLANAPALALLGCNSVEELSHDLEGVAARARVRDASTGEALPLERWPFTVALDGEQRVQDLIIHHAALGRDVTLRCVAAPIRVNGEPIGAVAVHTDLRFSRQHLLLRRLIAAQEEERRALAYELHDGLTQYVMAAHAHLESFQDAWREEEEAERAERELDRSVTHLEQAVIESRRLVSGLRALALEDLGLAGALEQLVREEKARAGWQGAEFVHNIAGRRFEEALETTVFRVAQEALTNARRHGQASQVRVLLLLIGGEDQERDDQGQREKWGGDSPGEQSSEQPSYVTLEVRDWGRGFVPRTGAAKGLGAGGHYSHLGLQGMVERVNLVDGSFHLRSRPGEGTTIHAVFPTQLRPIVATLADGDNDDEEITQQDGSRNDGGTNFPG